MDNLQELLSKIEGAPQETDRGELEKWLKSQDSQIGKMQQSISKTSERYTELKEKREFVEQALKVLRREAREQKQKEELQKNQSQGGLVPKGTSQSASETENPFAAGEKRYDDCRRVMKGNDLEAKKNLYREISIGAENGDGISLLLLGCIYDWEYREDQAGRLWDMAAEKGNPWAIYLRAWGLKDGNQQYGYQKDTRKAFEEYGRFLSVKVPLNMARRYDKYALIRYYELALELDKEDGKQSRLGEVEEIEERLRPLWEDPKSNEEAAWMGRKLMGDILSDRGNYVDAVGYYMKAGWDESVEMILDCFQKITDLQIKQRLEERIIHERENGSNTVRGKIHYWYGKRYEEGNGVKRDKVKAFLSYWEAEKLGNGEGRRKRIAMITNARENMDLLAEDFLVSIGEAGYWDAYKYLGDYYAHLIGISNYEKAQEYYLKAQNGSMKEECVKECNRMAELVEQAIIYKNAVKLLDSDRYEYAFNELKKIAEKGYPEACMTVAEISEDRTGYLALKLKGSLLGDKDIRYYYKKAADAGMVEAIKKMIAIYRDGLLGAQPDREARKKWENRLKI